MARLAFFTKSYNGEKYIDKAIESVLNQTFSDFTYYILDDKSTDNTVDMIKAYAEKDSRIIPFFSSENKKMGYYTEYFENLINSGEEFFCWLDNDDWYQPTFAEKMIASMDEFGSDMAVCSSVYLDENTLREIGTNSDITALIKKENYNRYFRSMHVFMRPLWAKIFRMSIIKNNALKFRTDFFIGADTAFVFDYVRHSKDIYISGDILHNYLVRSRSVSRTYKQDMFVSAVQMHDFTIDWLKDMDAYSLPNVEFIASVFLNAVKDSADALMASDLSLEEKTLHIYEIFKDDTVEQITILSNSQEEVVISRYKQHIKWIWDIIQSLKKEDFEVNIPIRQIGECIIDHHEVLTRVKGKHDLIMYPQIIGSIIHDDYRSAGDAINKEMADICDNDLEPSLALIDLSIYVAAINEDADMFISANKAMLKYYLHTKDKDNFFALADEITALLPDDDEIIELNARWNDNNN